MELEQRRKARKFIGSLLDFLRNIDNIGDMGLSNNIGELFWGNEPIIRLYSEGNLVASTTKKDVCNKGANHVRGIAYRFVESLSRREQPFSLYEIATEEKWFRCGHKGQIAGFHINNLAQIGVLRRVEEGREVYHNKYE